MAARRDFHADQGLWWGLSGVGILLLFIVAGLGPIFAYNFCRIEVPSGYMAILIHKTGQDLSNDEEIAPTAEHKGIQQAPLGEGRYFYNPYNWEWAVVPQIEIPQGKLGVRIRLYGDDLSYGEILARQENQKGIVPEVLNPGRYLMNACIVAPQKKPAREIFSEIIELHDPVVVPAGFKGVVTNLAGPLAKSQNALLVKEGERGVLETALEPGTYYINPYQQRIDLVDCRSQRFTLSTDGEMGFPSKDGFWVTLDGIIEFRVMPEEAARVLVIYNELSDDVDHTANIEKEIINKIILPNARSFCRLRGSDLSGRDFIDSRAKFERDFQTELEATCEPQGIEIIQALITKVNPPEQIAKPVRDRQIALQEEKQYQREILQQESEQQLAMEKEMVTRKQELIGAEQSVVKLTTEAEQKQEVALIEANQRLKVAELELKAAQDMADATLAKGKAAAQVLEFQNQAEAAGWKKAIAAFGGKGNEYARWTMLKKLGPSFRQMMVNTADSPIMDLFRQYSEPEVPSVPSANPVADR